MHDLFGGWFVAPPWGEFDPDQKVNGVGESVYTVRSVRACASVRVLIFRHGLFLDLMYPLVSLTLDSSW